MHRRRIWILTIMMHSDLMARRKACLAIFAEGPCSIKTSYSAMTMGHHQCSALYTSSSLSDTLGSSLHFSEASNLLSQSSPQTEQ